MDTSVTVQRHLAGMIRVEQRIEETLSRQSPLSAGQDRVADALKLLRETSTEHRRALEDRLQMLRSVADLSLSAEDDRPEELCELYGAISRAAMGYAVLQALAHRSFDREGEGNTRDVANSLLKDYARAAIEISALVSDSALRELDQTGDECRCQCTTCALGICTCAPMGIGRAHKQWLDTVLSGVSGEILVTAPRRDSAADRAGLRAGDVILAADGQTIQANAELHAAIKTHQPGELVRLRVRRASGDVAEIAIIC